MVGETFGIPNHRAKNESASNGSVIDTGLATITSFHGTTTTVGGSVSVTSVSGGKVTIAMYNAAGVAISAAETIYWTAWGRD